MSMFGKMFYDEKKTATIALILLLFLFIAGCSSAPTPPNTVSPTPKPTPTPAAVPASVSLSEPEAVTAAVRTALHAFLSSDFSAAQKTMLFQPAEQQDAKTNRLFAEFSAHLSKRLALDAKSAGRNAAAPFVSVSNIRPDTNGVSLADVSIGAGPDLEPLRLTLKVARHNGVWLVDHAFFMLALIDALDE